MKLLKLFLKLLKPFLELYYLKDTAKVSILHEKHYKV